MSLRGRAGTNWDQAVARVSQVWPGHRQRPSWDNTGQHQHQAMMMIRCAHTFYTEHWAAADVTSLNINTETIENGGLFAHHRPQHVCSQPVHIILEMWKFDPCLFYTMGKHGRNLSQIPDQYLCLWWAGRDKLLHISGHCTQSKGGSAYGYMGILSLIFTIEHS